MQLKRYPKWKKKSKGNIILSHRLTSNPPNDQLIENYERQIEENEEKIAIIQQNMKIEVDSLKNQLLALNNENEQMKMQLEVSYQEKELVK